MDVRIMGPATKKKTKKKPTKPFERGKRKEAVARAVVVPGTGKIYFNEALVSSLSDPQLRGTISEPLGYFASKDSVDVHVSAVGGGSSGQAQAARTAVARALCAHAGGEARRELSRIDRSLIVEDARRVEPKKFKGPKARARFTKSYR